MATTLNRYLPCILVARVPAYAVRVIVFRGGGRYNCRMLKRESFDIASIYVPQARRKTLDPAKVEALAESILESGLQAPILVRPDGARFVLVEGLHRLEACKALGETSIDGYLVQARRH